jgi:hypothetical protein
MLGVKESHNYSFLHRGNVLLHVNVERIEPVKFALNVRSLLIVKLMRGIRENLVFGVESLK